MFAQIFRAIQKILLTLILALVIFNLSSAQANEFSSIDKDVFVTENFDSNVIINWNPEIPVSATELLSELQNQAGVYAYDGDLGSCGGQIQIASLREHRRVFDTNGTALHIVKIRFEVTMPVNYCESEKVTRCEIKYNILNPTDISQSQWRCEE
jgi:hypothetical protein